MTVGAGIVIIGAVTLGYTVANSRQVYPHLAKEHRLTLRSGQDARAGCASRLPAVHSATCPAAGSAAIAAASLAQSGSA